MSRISQTTPPYPTEGHPVTNLTLVVLLLIPCVVVLLLLNCLFLGYKLLILSKSGSRQKRADTEEMLLQSTLQRIRRLSDVAFPPLQDGRRAYMSVSEPVLPRPVTSSRASSRERAGVDHRIRLLRPDGATGSGSLRAPSTIRATSSAAGFTPRRDLPSGSRAHGVSKAGGWRSAPVLPQSSDSEAETRINLVPPNSPTVSPCGFCRRTATVCPTACWPQLWSGIIMTPAMSNRIMYPNINTPGLQCALNSTGCDMSSSFNVFLCFDLFNLI
ncbi:protein huluwa isoform X3 [Xiphias gladius]|uniref:protein huluwa isoform X3 n=1 Tax=Xiphias gladius TaxID=8245 RepID=UPI001A9858CC|nr:protein huluwa isoform X3 [Xiphias gladius]